jgi:hypothetical protein
MKNIVLNISYALFVLTGVMAYAFVFDCEPIDPIKEYALDRDCFNRNNGDWNREFPSYAEWLGETERSEEKFHEWVHSVFHEVALQSAEIFDPWYQRPPDNSWDTREGQGSCAPENWVSGKD